MNELDNDHLLSTLSPGDTPSGGPSGFLSARRFGPPFRRAVLAGEPFWPASRFGRRGVLAGAAFWPARPAAARMVRGGGLRGVKDCCRAYLRPGTPVPADGAAGRDPARCRRGQRVRDRGRGRRD